MTPTRFTRGVLVAGALAFAGPGAGFLLAPAVFTGAVDVAMLGPTGWSDVRAVFGGLELGLAALLAACALVPRLERVGVAVLGCTIGGLLVGRLTSLALDGPPGAFGWLLFAIEVALLVAAAVAWGRARAPAA